MSGTIWTKFYWSDWETDHALKLCSFAAQGLWMRMLCIASAHDPIGYVAVAGRALDETAIARMTGGQESEVHDLLGELDRNGVFSRDRQGRIYSRRMVTDARRAAIARKNGKNGGNPSLGKGKGNAPQDNPPDNPSLKTQEPYATNQKEVGEAKASLVAGSDVQAAYALWNELAGRIGLPIAKALTDDRRKHIRARLEQGGLEGWQEALTGVERSKHCRGQNDRGWKADLDFVCQPKSYQRLREGTYGADMPAASGASAAPAAPWPGPPQLRAAVVDAAGEDVARGYVDTATWRAEDRALVVRNAFMADRLRREAGPTLDRLKVTVAVAEGRAA